VGFQKLVSLREVDISIPVVSDGGGNKRKKKSEGAITSIEESNETRQTMPRNERRGLKTSGEKVLNVNIQRHHLRSEST